MKSSEVWFQEKQGRVKAIHWKGRVVETLPILFAMVWMTVLYLRVSGMAALSETAPYLAFSALAAAQSLKYYLYHEKR